MLPAIFAVEDDAHQCRLGAVDCLADAAQPGDKILRRLRRIAPLIVKSNHVAQGVVPKDDAQLGARLGHFVRPIHSLRIAHEAAIVPADESLSRLAQNFLVGGDPADAVLGQKGDHFLADGSFRRPHAGGRAAEDLGVLLHRSSKVDRGVFGITAGVARQLEVRQCLAGQLLVEHQGEYRMIERRCRQLDLAVLRQFSVKGDHLAQNFQVLIQEPMFFIL